MTIFDEIKYRLTCIDILTERGIDVEPRKKTGCPLCNYHKSKTFYADEDHFYCHHCHKGGDVFRLVEAMDNIDSSAALKLLAEKAGVEQQLSPERIEKQKQSEAIRASRSEAFREMAEAFSELPEAALEYLQNRGLTPDFIRAKMIGFVPEKTPSLDESDPKARYLIEAGLPGILRGRILIPFWQGGAIVYFTGRSLPGSQGGPKYLNQKGEKTFCGTIRGPELYVTEGPFDQLMAEQAGYNCIALAGSGKMPRLHAGVKRVVLAFDGDDAGRAFTEKHALEIYEQGVEVSILTLQDGEDLADHIQKNGAVVAPELPLVRHYLSRLRAEPKNKEVKVKLYRVVQRMDEIDREEILSELKALWKVSLATVRKDYLNYTEENSINEYRSPDDFVFRVPEGYAMTESGIVGNKKPITHEPIYVSKIGIEKQNGMEYCEIKYRSNGSSRSRIIPRKSISISGDLLEESAFGAPVNSANVLEIIRFMDAWMARNKDIMPEFEATSQLGWLDDRGVERFVTTGDVMELSDTGVRDSTEQSIFYHGSVPERAYKARGTLEGWVDAIKPLGALENGHVVRFILYASFASALLEPLDLPNFIVHLHGDTSTGKTSALRLAASVYGAPVVGDAMIRWHATKTFLARYLSILKNVPLVIDELSSEDRPSHDDVIYIVESGLTKGKADRLNPDAVTKQATFHLGAFSSGEPPLLGDHSMGGASIRVWEFNGSPFGCSCPELVASLIDGIKKNYGVVLRPFLDEFARNRHLFINPESFIVKPVNSLSDVERRLLPVLNCIYTAGRLVNKLFSLGWDVGEDMFRVFEAIRIPIADTCRTVDNILDEIQGGVAQNPLAFPIVEKDPLDYSGQRNVLKPIDGKIPAKVYGYIFPNPGGSSDLGIIKNYFNEWMGRVRHQTNAGKYVISLLKERGIIEDTRTLRRIEGQAIYLVYIKNFFPAPSNMFDLDKNSQDKKCEKSEKQNFDSGKLDRFPGICDQKAEKQGGDSKTGGVIQDEIF